MARHKISLIPLLLIGLLMATSLMLYAQVPSTPVDTILLEDVTVSVLPFGETHRNATGALFRIDPETVDPSYAITNTGLINMAPGIHMASGGYNTNRLVIRGVGSRTPYGTNRIRAYLDDIPLTSGDGVSTLEDMDLYGIGIMEVLKGPSSALYGSGLGGVLRFNSPYPAYSGFGAMMFGEYGSFNTGRYGFTSSFKNEKVAVAGGATRSSSDGYRQNSSYLRNSFFLNMKHFGYRNTLSLTLSLVDLSAGIPSSLNQEDFLNDPWKAAGNWLEVKGREEYTRLLGGIKLESRLGKRLGNHLILFSNLADPYESRPFNILDDRSANAGFREYLQYELASWNFRAGMEYFHEWVDWQIYETNQGMKGKLLTDQNETRRQTNAFALVQWKSGNRLLIDGGININVLHYGLQTHFRADSTDQSGQYSYDTELSPRLGLSYQYFLQHYLYASAGHGFSAPSLEETLLPEGNLNTDLRPESGWNLEFGSRGEFQDGRIIYDATMYAIILDDLLVTERIAEDIFYGINAGKAMNTGLELLMDLSLNPPGRSYPFDISAIMAYTLSVNRFTEFINDGIDHSGNFLPGIPLQKLNTSLVLDIRSVDLKLNYLFTGKQWMDDANTLEHDPYHLLHFHGSWLIPDFSSPLRFEIKAGIRNITNSDYASMILVNAPSFGGKDPRYFYPGLPRQFHFGINCRFIPPGAVKPSVYREQ